MNRHRKPPSIPTSPLPTAAPWKPRIPGLFLSPTRHLCNTEPARDRKTHGSAPLSPYPAALSKCGSPSHVETVHPAAPVRNGSTGNPRFPFPRAPDLEIRTRSEPERRQQLTPAIHFSGHNDYDYEEYLYRKLLFLKAILATQNLRSAASPGRAQAGQGTAATQQRTGTTSPRPTGLPPHPVCPPKWPTFPHLPLRYH